VNILFTSAGRRVELLREFRRALTDLSIDGSVIAIDIDPLAPALSQADRYYMVPRITEPGFVPTVLDICERDNIDLLIPLVDRDIPVLVPHRDDIESRGTRALLPTAEAADIVSDKWLTYEFFSGLGVDTPRSWLPEQARAEELDYPVFIKPRFGSAGEGTFRVNNRRELDFFLTYVDRPIVQEYLPGPEITSDVLCDLAGNVAAVVSRRRIEVRTGEVSKGVTVLDPEIIERCVAVAKGLESIGPITVQCLMRADGSPCFTEVNHRFGGGIPLAVAAGAPYPHWLLALAADRNVGIPPLGSYREGVYLTRFDESLIMTKQERHDIQSHRF
jgi:carbamoyl-phosphate synthase large subunit